jgi:hypothetical protein
VVYPPSFNKLIDVINNLLGKGIKPKYVPSEKNYVEALCADTTLMKKLLKIEITPLEEVVKKFISYLETKK